MRVCVCLCAVSPVFNTWKICAVSERLLVAECFVHSGVRAKDLVSDRLSLCLPRLSSQDTELALQGMQTTRRVYVSSFLSGVCYTCYLTAVTIDRFLFVLRWVISGVCILNGRNGRRAVGEVSTMCYTHNTQPFYGSVEFVRENPGEPVPEETFTHYSHRSHQSSLSAFSI